MKQFKELEKFWEKNQIMFKIGNDVIILTKDNKESNNNNVVTAEYTYFTMQKLLNKRITSIYCNDYGSITTKKESEIFNFEFSNDIIIYW